MMTCAQLVETPWGKFYVWPQDSVGAAIARNEFWDSHLKPVMDEVPPGKMVVDAGASMGFFTIYLALRGCYVHAFEPCTPTFELLMENVKANGVEDMVVVHNVALYDRDTDLAFNTEVFHGWYSVPMRDGEIDYPNWAHVSGFALAPWANSTKKFPARKLDNYKLDVYLIKSDAQGCDLRVMKGARDTIERCHPVLIYEVEPPLVAYHGDMVEDYSKFIDDIGYEPTILNDSSEYYDYVARKK